MRWSIVIPACVVATVAVADVASPLSPSDIGALVLEHRANQRAIALAQLAEAHGSHRLRVLGRHIARELGFVDGQVLALAHQRGASLDATTDGHTRSARDRLARIAKLDGLAFDRAVLAALGDELVLDLDWLDSTRGRPHDGALTTLLATMRPLFGRYHAEVGWLGAIMRPAT
jgi:hypothetical protein